MFDNELADYNIEQGIMEAERLNPHEIKPTPGHSGFWLNAVALAESTMEDSDRLIDLYFTGEGDENVCIQE